MNSSPPTFVAGRTWVRRVVATPATLALVVCLPVLAGCVGPPAGAPDGRAPAESSATGAFFEPFAFGSCDILETVFYVSPAEVRPFLPGDFVPKSFPDGAQVGIGAVACGDRARFSFVAINVDVPADEVLRNASVGTYVWAPEMAFADSAVASLYERAHARENPLERLSLSVSPGRMDAEGVAGWRHSIRTAAGALVDGATLSLAFGRGDVSAVRFYSPAVGGYAYNDMALTEEDIAATRIGIGPSRVETGVGTPARGILGAERTTPDGGIVATGPGTAPGGVGFVPRHR